MFRILLLAILLSGPTPAKGAEILVFAAASLTDALQEVANAYHQKSSDKVKFSFGASSVLARQIQAGARADIFFSADEEKMEQLQNLGLVRTNTRKSLLSNQLVVTVLRDNSFSTDNSARLTNLAKIAIAEPSTVPAGIYARRYLEMEGIWNSLKLVPTDNVRAALLAVESGNVDAAIVYKTDAAMSSKVKIAFSFKPRPEIPILYPVAVMDEARHPSAAELFLDYCRSIQAKKIFENHGFIVLPVSTTSTKL
jgi:molybdate transport system substrate-binding protein